MSPGKTFRQQQVESDAYREQMRKLRPESKGLLPVTEDTNFSGGTLRREGK